MSKWLEIAERCERATGPDQELDAAIDLLVGGPQGFFGPAFDAGHVDGPECFYGEAKWAGSGELYEAPASTASIDAITAMIERELPGWRWLASLRDTPLGARTGEGYVFNGELHSSQKYRGFDVFAQTPALALCAAFCRALHANRLTSQDQGDNG